MKNPEPTPEQLHALAVSQQQRFDELAAEQDRSAEARIALRQQMLADMCAMERIFRRLLDKENPVEVADRRRLEDENLALLERFEAAVESYANERAQDRARLIPMRDALAAFFATRARLSALGFAAPDLIHHERVAACMESAAFEATSRRSDTGQN